MEERYVAHLWNDKLRGEIIIAVFLIAISVIILSGAIDDFLDAGSGPIGAPDAEGYKFVTKVCVIPVAIYMIGKSISAYRWEKEFLVLTKEGIEYTYGRKQKKKFVPWAQLEYVACCKVDNPFAKVTAIDYKYNGGKWDFWEMRLAKEDGEEIYQQIMTYWERYGDAEKIRKFKEEKSKK